MCPSGMFFLTNRENVLQLLPVVPTEHEAGIASEESSGTLLEAVSRFIAHSKKPLLLFIDNLGGGSCKSLSR